MKQSKIKFLMFLTLYIIHCTLYITQAQPVKKDFTFYRGDLVKLTFQINGNVTTYDLLFAAKLTKSFSAPRLIQKTNAASSQISAVYAAPFTKIEVYLLPEDTRDLTSKVYYYDLIKTDPADSTKETTLFTGELKNDADVVTPFDGTNLAADGTRITTVSIDNGTVQDEMLYWDATTHRWQPAGTTLSQAQRDSIGSTVRDSLNALLFEDQNIGGTWHFNNAIFDSLTIITRDTTTIRTYYIISKSTDYTLTNANDVAFVTTSTTSKTITLPITNIPDGRIFTIKKIDSGAGTVIINVEGGGTIDGQSTLTIFYQYTSYRLVKNGSNYLII